MKNVRKILLCLICSLFLVSIVQVTAMDTNLSLNIQTDKTEYDLREIINVNVTATNRSELEINNLEIEAICPQGLEVLPDNDLKFTEDELKSGESVSCQFGLTSIEKKNYSRDVKFLYSKVEKKLNEKNFYNPIENYDGEVSFSSSNENVAVVDEKGNVTFIGTGVTVINANIPENDEYYSYSFSYVLQVNENKISENKKKEQFIKFKSDKVEKKVTDNSFTNQLIETGKGTGEVKYYSSNEKIASVDLKTGEVSINSVGKVTITAIKTEDENYKSAYDTFELIINDNVKTEDVEKSDSNKSNIDTGDKTYISSYVILFLISFIILTLCANKKYRKKIFMLLLVCSLFAVNFKNVSAIGESDNLEHVVAEKKIKVNNQIHNLKVKCSYKTNESNSDYIPKEDASEYYDDNLYADLGNEEYIDINKDTLEEYYSNELIVACNKELNEETEKNILSLIDESYIVGKNKYTQTYQIRFNKSKSYEELSEILVKLKSLGYNNSHLNKVLRVNFNSNDSYYPDDKRWENEWSNYPGGSNWGIEAINAPLLWKYYKEMTTINIGIMDEGFDTEHKDLKEVLTLLNNNTENMDHGSHVTGIIGASFNNSLGICGVSPTAKISAIAHDSIVSEFTWTVGITNLVRNDCKVINVSMGYSDNYIFAASQSVNKETQFLIQEDIKATASDLEYELNKLTEQFNFVICVASGNGDKKQYVPVKQSYTGYAEITEEENTFYKVYIDSDSSREVKERLIDNDVNHIINASGIIDAKWGSPLAAISNQKLINRIIVVGAAELNDNESYIKANFSNGGKRVDVIAPGVDIYSTVSKNLNFYDYKDGTSMASPHVAGLAGMLYSLNSELTGEQIKEIIVESATTEVLDAEGKKMINAWNAYDLMTKKYTGKLSGRVIDEDGNPIEGANIHIQGQNKDVLTDVEGKFIIDSSVGIQEYIIQKEGYQNFIGSEKIINGTTTIILNNIVLKKKNQLTNKIIGTVYSNFDKLPLGNVSIKVYDLGDDEPIVLGNSLEDGRFDVEISENASRVEFSCAGFQTKSIDLLLHNSEIDLGDIYLNLGDDEFTGFAGGDGTINDPYQISTPAQLDAVRLNLNAHYILKNDIDMSKKTDWIPIGGIEGFSGSLNGNNHKIINLSIIGNGGANSTSTTVTLNSGDNAFGLFSILNSQAHIDNLKLSNINIEIKGCYADIGIISGISYGTIKNCSVNGYILGVKGGINDSNSGDYIRTSHGGIVGRNHGYIQYCKATSSNSESWYGGVVGGIAGYNIGTVDSCETTNLNMYGDSPRNGVALAGGIVGRNTGEIKLCHSNATVYACAAAGGIAGSNSNLISYCYFDGAVSAKAVTSTYGAMDGGIVGSNGDKWRIGYKGKINNCVYTTSQYVCRYNGGSSCLGIVESNYTTVEEGREIIDKIDNEIQKISN